MVRVESGGWFGGVVVELLDMDVGAYMECDADIKSDLSV